MRVRAVLVTGLCLAFAPTIEGQDATPAIADVAKRYVDARGGLEAIRSVRTLILRGPPRPNGRPGRWMAKARPYYWMVGEPSQPRDYAEGFDGSAWEYYANPGLVLRTSGAPAAAARHTAYFDDPLVYFGDPGWRFELRGKDRVGADSAHRILAVNPDGFEREVFVDPKSWLVVAYRAAAPIHAFGAPVRGETRISDYRRVNGALFPMRFDEYEIATGKLLDGGGWQSFEANVALPRNFFSPPAEPDTPLARMLNAAFASREFPSDVLMWYRDFRANPATKDIDTEVGVEAVGFQILKTGAVRSAIALLEANLVDYPRSPAAHFGLGRAYRTAGREREAVAAFRAALAIDPKYQRALDALAAPPPPPNP